MPDYINRDAFKAAMADVGVAPNSDDVTAEEWLRVWEG